MDIVERLMSRHCCQDNLDQEAAQEIERLRKDNERLREALQSIANNSCCGTCQEAALIARKALGEKE